MWKRFGSVKPQGSAATRCVPSGRTVVQADKSERLCADTRSVVPNRSSLRFLPHSLIATFVVMLLPSLAAAVLTPDGSPLLVALSVLLAMSAAVVLASAGSAFWMRRPSSQDLVFGDLMLWGWVRKLRAERRLAQARALLIAGDASADTGGLSREQRCDELHRLGSLLEARDAYTHGHTRRVTRHAERIAREMGLPADEVGKVRVAAALHDVGKLHTPREVLTKPGRLTDEEFAIVKRHPVDGAAMVAEVCESEITEMVRHHHERLDGTGYPDGLAGDEIPLGARIISVADTFDAMTSSRPYRRACQHKKALDVLSKEAGTQLDPAPVAAFMRYYSGKRSVAWSAFVVTAPQRMLGWVGNVFQGVGAGVAPVAQAVLATGVAGLAGASMAGSAPPANAVAEPAREVAAHHQAKAREETGPAHDRGQRSERRRSDARPDSGRRSRGRRQRPRSGPGGGGERPGKGTNGGHADDPRQPEGGGGNGGGESGPGPGTSPPFGPEPKGGGGDPAPSPVPKIELPKVDLPIVEEPEIEVPAIELPTVEVPKVEVPDVKLPGLKAPGVELPSLP
jgi:putative nucleotidyltransferase with HDIG domain